MQVKKTESRKNAIKKDKLRVYKVTLKERKLRSCIKNIKRIPVEHLSDAVGRDA